MGEGKAGEERGRGDVRGGGDEDGWTGRTVVLAAVEGRARGTSEGIYCLQEELFSMTNLYYVGCTGGSALRSTY